MIGILESLVLAVAIIGIVTLLGLKSINHKQLSKFRSTKISEFKKMSTRKQITVLSLSVVLGVGIRLMVDYPYTINWHNASFMDFLIGFTSALYGYTGFYLFTMLSMAISIFSLIPIFASYLQSSYYLPVVRGVTIGFGIMLLYQFFTHGIPKIIS